MTITELEGAELTIEFDESDSGRFRPVGDESSFIIGKGKKVLVESTSIAVFRLEDGFYAIEDTCPHAQASLSLGFVADGVVACPRHGAQFDIRSGRLMSLPAVHGVRTFPVKVVNGTVMVALGTEESDTPDILRFD